MADDKWDSTPSHTGRRRIEQIMDNSNDTGGGDDGSSSSSTSSSSSSSSKSESKEATMSVDILSTYEEALNYAEMMWGKLQRDNGRSLSCQTWGSCEWNVGDWVQVYLPSFYIDGFMYVTTCSQSNDGGDWTSSLTLVDYPPGWGKYEPPEETEDDEDEDEDDEDDSSDGGSS